MSLIRISADIPFIRDGEAYGPWIFSASNRDGSAAFPSGTTYECRAKASTDAATLATGTVTRVSDSEISISLSGANVDAIVAGLVFSTENAETTALCVLEIVRTSSPAATLAIIKLDVVK